MSKYIKSYFYTENDAESAKAALQPLRIENEIVEPFHDRDGFHLKEILQLTSDKDKISQLLHFHVQEEDYNKALKIIKEHNGHPEPEANS